MKPDPPSRPESARGSDHVGDLAIVLHSHMPYVEGFGTYPFGEEWLFDAVARSHLPVLGVARGVTITVTPVLADQLEAEAVASRMSDFLSEFRLGAARADARNADVSLRPAAQAEVDRLESALGRLEALDGDPLQAFRDAADDGVELMASSATHAVLPKLATAEAVRLQIDAGLRSHARRFGRSAGFWLPECAFVPGLERFLSERGISHTCLDQSAAEEGSAALEPVALGRSLTGFTIDWPTIELVWAESGYPSAPEYLEHHRESLNGVGLWAISGDPYDPEAARARARSDADDFLDRVSERLAAFRRDHAKPGLCTFAVDTELLGHWWREGPDWLAHVLEGAAERGIDLIRLSEARERHPGAERALTASSWGEAKSFVTWDSPRAPEFPTAARRSELRLLSRVAAGVDGAVGERAARELLALQSSDWAFMAHRGEAGEYPYERASAHAEALLEALDSGRVPSRELRNLAPDLSLSPLLEP